MARPRIRSMKPEFCWSEAIARNAQAVIDGELPAEPTVAAILRMAAVAADAIEDC